MKINKLYKTVGCLAIACFSFAITSCSDEFFDVEVGERITSDQHYEDYIDAKLSFYGTIISLQDVAANAIVVDGLRSDQMILNANASTDLQEIESLNMRESNPFLDKSGYYKTIINCNEVLAEIQTAADKDRDFLDGEVYDMKSTLYGLRAYCYLTVARNYGEVNYIDTNLSELPDNTDGNILSKEAIIDTLIYQFENDSVIYDASVNGDDRKENVFTDFPSYHAVLGELYLERGQDQTDYEKAIYYFRLGLEIKPSETLDFGEYDAYSFIVYDLTYMAEESWNSIFSTSTVVECLGVVPYNQSEDQPNPVAGYFMPQAEFAIRPAQPLIDSMEMAIQGNLTDTADLYRGMGVTYDTITAGDYYISKYSQVTGNEYNTDVIIQRAGGIHLLLAEALNRAGRTTDAMMFLNSGLKAEKSSDRPADFSSFSKNLGVRGRVALAPHVLPADSVIAADGINVVEMVEDWILEEQAMECAFEGHRMSDLIRIALRRDNPEQFLSSIVARKYTDVGQQSTVMTYYMNRENWYLP